MSINGDTFPRYPYCPGFPDWGHDFRLTYLRIVRILKRLPRNVAILATTATANARVVADVLEQIGDGMTAMRSPLERRR